MSTVVALTGVTGFIGHAVARALVGAGYQVRALVRSPAKLRDGPLSFEVVQGSLSDRSALGRLVVGTAAVVHCAGSVRGATQDAFDSVNVAGTAALLETMESLTNTPRLLHLSSLAAREPDLSLYALSKRRSEQLLTDHASRVRWMALRPPPVYGPGDRELLPLFRLMARGIAVVPGSPEARVSMLYVDDLAAAVLAWLQAVEPATGIYALHDGRENGYNWLDIAAIVGEICAKRVHPVTLPRWLLDVPATLNRWGARRLGYAPMLTPEKLRELRHPDWVCDNAALAAVLDWRPAVQLAEGLRRTPGWPGYDPLAAPAA